MPIMTANDAKAAAYFLIFALVLWWVYGSNHSDDHLVPAINSFWLGAIVFMIMFYIFFSRSQV